MVWSLNMLVQTRPAAPDSTCDIIVAVDTLLGMVTCLDSTNVTRWFHAKIVWRYGLPGLIRTDSSPEYKGEFRAYLREAGSHHWVISARNPRANRQVEQFNQMIKMNLRKFAIECPTGKWW